MVQKQTLQSYQSLAQKVLRGELGTYVSKVEVREDYDFADEEALFFEAYLKKDAPRDLGKQFVSAHVLLRRALEALGEERFPYLNTRRPVGDNEPTEMFLKTPRREGSLARRTSAR